MPKVTRGWPPERRKEQAERLRQSKPWLKSSGPKTESGKNRSSKNATTHGRYTKAGRRLRKALRDYRQMIVTLEMLGKLSPADFKKLTGEKT